VGVFEKLLWENTLDHKTSRLSTRWLETQPAITCKQSTRKDLHQLLLRCAHKLSVRALEITKHHRTDTEITSGAKSQREERIGTWAADGKQNHAIERIPGRAAAAAGLEHAQKNTTQSFSARRGKRRASGRTRDQPTLAHLKRGHGDPAGRETKNSQANNSSHG
jgi:hypothetical protein